MTPHPLIIASDLYCDHLRSVLAELRTGQGLSQNRMAQRAGMSPQMIGYVELGKRRPKVDINARLALSLGEMPSAVFARVEASIGVERLEDLVRLSQL